MQGTSKISQSLSQDQGSPSCAEIPQTAFLQPLKKKQLHDIMEERNSTSNRQSKRGETKKRAILILHGNRQTGELFLGRIGSLRRKLVASNSTSSSRNGKECNNRGSISRGRKESSLRQDAIDATYLVAPDAPFQYRDTTAVLSKDDELQYNDTNTCEVDDSTCLRTWWIREGEGHSCIYQGLEESIDMLHTLWCTGTSTHDYAFEGILGFSQGAYLAYLISILHTLSSKTLFPGLRFMILSGGYGHIPLPCNFYDVQNSLFHKYNAPINDISNLPFIDIPTLHIIGRRDKVVLPSHSYDLLSNFHNAVLHEHDGGHFVPTKAKDIEAYLTFIAQNQSTTCIHESLPFIHPESIPSNLKGRNYNIKNSTRDAESNNGPSSKNVNTAGLTDQETTSTRETTTETSKTTIIQKDVDAVTDNDRAVEQINECEALQLIYSDEYEQISLVRIDSESGEKIYVFPIEYKVRLVQSILPSSLALRIAYPSEYPDVPPTVSLDHTMNSMQFSTKLEQTCLTAVRNVSAMEIGMPCAMSCILAANDFFENLGIMTSPVLLQNDDESRNCDGISGTSTMSEVVSDERHILGIPANDKIIQSCDDEGQRIANKILNLSLSPFCTVSSSPGQHQQQGQALPSTQTSFSTSNGNGGLWKYTIGLVGKPSAGKSTFFNAATGFARQQRDDDSFSSMFGASMAPHPFTTIDPNVGFCFVPALPGSCPEDLLSSKEEKFAIGSTHGRDSYGRRLIPITLKDVAGLVPGAYKGRGRGNKFLDDLTDADVLIHVVDASGTADADGNCVGVEGGTHPLQDLAWVRKELLEWISCNMEAKWETVIRKGQNRLADMFTGYKQSQSFVWNILLQVEKFMATDENIKFDRALDHLERWNGGDLRRLVNAFLGLRFPMALALNKSDVVSAIENISDIHRALPVHGAHIGVALSAKREMEFVRSHMGLNTSSSTDKDGGGSSSPEGVWNCLQAAISLRNPILVFPVSDMVSYEPLPGMKNYATLDASLPSEGYIRCIEACGGSKPTLWDNEKCIYQMHDGSHHKVTTTDRFRQPLRDVLVMKPGSTVEDVFDALKRMGALRGDYVRAEGSGKMGEKPHLVRKEDVIDSTNRILKIMTNKRM